MNFIVKLLKFKKLEIQIKYNFILVIVDRLIKQVYFILYWEATGAQDIVYIFNWYIISNYNISAEIIINRDTRFRLIFWKLLAVFKKIY